MTRAPLTDGSPDDAVLVGATAVYGLPVDAQTRCAHYSGATDVIAIRFPCCDRYYPCHECHEAVADHSPERWPAEARDEHAILCGVCASTLTIRDYLVTDDCPRCGTAFNPGCRLHHPLYFA